jgi:hypothetical protein
MGWILYHELTLLNLWDIAQNSILRLIFSVGLSTSCASMRVLLHLQSAWTRHDELSCRWACSLDLKTGRNFLIANVLSQAKAVKMRDSCISYILGDPPIRENCNEERHASQYNWSSANLTIVAAALILDGEVTILSWPLGRENSEKVKGVHGQPLYKVAIDRRPNWLRRTTIDQRPGCLPGQVK